MKESVIHVGLGTATIIVLAMFGGTAMVLSAMNNRSAELYEAMSVVDERVYSLRSHVEVHDHMMNEVLGTVTSTTDTMNQVLENQANLTIAMDKTIDNHRQVFTSIEQLHSFVAGFSNAREISNSSE